jgi:holo-[acyl-carrier protein] synthase
MALGIFNRSLPEPRFYASRFWLVYSGRVLSSRGASLVTILVGLGVDLVETARVDRVLARYGDRFVRRLMDADEAARLPASGSARIQALALAIAAKEAASKALGTGWSRGVRWRDVVVLRSEPPAVQLRGRAAAVARERGSSGHSRTRLAIEGPLAVGEVWLLR